MAFETIANDYGLNGKVAIVSGAQAQDFPTKPVRIIVGPGPDIVARMFGQKFTDSWGHQTIVEQRPGGGGVIATEMVARRFGKTDRNDRRSQT